MLSRKSSQKMWRRKYSGAMEVQQVLTGSCVKWHVKCQLLITPTAAAPESCDEEASVGRREVGAQHLGILCAF